MDNKILNSVPVDGFAINDSSPAKLRFEIRKARTKVLKLKRWYVLMIANNNQVLMVSQMYKHHKSAIRLLEIIERYVKKY
ncbi:MAG: hypothetical protein JEZ07_06405 [Phycisphaerae bacterium]|nr:hypothetical protein [Phycisphaerae bacterium]